MTEYAEALVDLEIETYGVWATTLFWPEYRRIMADPELSNDASDMIPTEGAWLSSPAQSSYREAIALAKMDLDYAAEEVYTGQSDFVYLRSEVEIDIESLRNEKLVAQKAYTQWYDFSWTKYNEFMATYGNTTGMQWENFVVGIGSGIQTQMDIRTAQITELDAAVGAVTEPGTITTSDRAERDFVEPEKDGTSPALIAAAVAGPLLVIGIIVGVLVVVRRRSNAKHSAGSGANGVPLQSLNSA